MIKSRSWLDLAEYSSFGGLIFGIITTAITKQILYSCTPLAFVLFFNSLNIRKHKSQLQEKSLQIQNLLKEEEKKNNILLQDLITFSNEYKYQKIELEELIEKAEIHKVELTNKISQDVDKSILNRLSNLEYLKSRTEKKITASIEVIENRIRKLESNEKEYNKHKYQSSIGELSTLTGLTQYYLLQGLTQKLIQEVKGSKEIQYLLNTEGNKKLSESIIKDVQKVVKHSQYLAEIVITYHNDHGCSRKEAEILSAELSQLAIELSMIRSAYDLTLMYKALSLFTHQISRFQHRKSKYCWNKSMREKMLNTLSDCLAKL